MFFRHRHASRASHRPVFAVMGALLVLSAAAAAIVPAPRIALAASATTTADLNLRAAPSLGAPVLLVIPDGGSVEVLGDADDGFVPVSYGGTRGYAHGDFLSTGGGNAAPPPVAGPSAGSARTTADLNLRAGPDLGATVLTVIPSGGAVTVLGDNQNGYSRVSYGGTTGWTHASYLTSGGGAPAPEVEPEAPSFSGPTGSAVTTADLNLRAGPNTSSEVLTVMAYGAIVSLTGRTQNSFHAIRHQGTEGWAHSDYLSIGTVPAPVPAQPTPAAPTPDAVPSQGPTGTAYTTAELNLRSGPSTSTGVVAVMPYGAALTVTGQRQAGFYSVSYSGTSGWAYATYLTTNAPAPAPTAPTPAPAAGSGGSGETDIVAIIYAAADRYGQPRADMLRVARCESLLDPNAVNPAGSYGLFQFIPSTWASTPYAAYDIFDPWASANAAGWMWSVGRRGEWTCQ